MKRFHRTLLLLLLVSLTVVSGCSRTSKVENAQTFADEAFKDLAHDWSEKTLKKYAGPEFYAQCDEKKAAQICKLLGSKLGPLTSYKGAKPQSPLPTPDPNNKTPLIIGFVAEADFRNGPGTALIMVQEKDGGRWSLNGFQIKSPVLMQQNPNPPQPAQPTKPPAKPAATPSDSPTP